MVLAQPKVAKLVNLNGTRLKRGAAPITLLGAAAASTRRSEAKAQDALMAKRAKLMLACRMNIHVTKEIPAGNFLVFDPETLPPEERAACPYKAKTVVVHPDDLDQAIQHFEKEGQA